jgi:hypothetical protein
MQKALEPVLLDHHDQINQMLINQNESVSKGVSAKLKLTLNMTEMIWAWLGELDQGTSPGSKNTVTPK